jgi:eukaryotic-like serine/threonine-protein kinase
MGTSSGSSDFGVGVREGEILAGKYRIDKVLGAGGMGVVVAAHHIQLDEKVAIKFMLPEALGSPEAVARFTREARAAVKIKSEHVARVSDVGVLDNGAPYMVMEYLEGGDLAAWVEQRGALEIEQAVEFVLQACVAIADAHGLRIVHRDLKPANLFCVRRSDALLSIKVLDFGISKITGVSSTSGNMGMTKTKAVMGSPLYMSPEQMTASRDVDARTDIWSLGVILYELIAGVVPFYGDVLPEVCVKIATEEPPPIRDRRPDVPEELERVILKCLRKKRVDRYANVAELALALAPFGPKRARGLAERAARVIQAAGLSQSALTMPASTDPSELAPASGTMSSWGSTARTGGGMMKTIMLAGGGLVLIACTAIATAIVLRKQQPAVPTTAAIGVAPSVIAPATPTPVVLAALPELPPPPAVPAAPSAAPVASAAPAVGRSMDTLPLDTAAAPVAPAPVKPPAAKEPAKPAKAAPADRWGGRK